MITGALTNLTTAVCSGTPGAPGLRWFVWHCLGAVQPLMASPCQRRGAPSSVPSCRHQRPVLGMVLRPGLGGRQAAQKHPPGHTAPHHFHVCVMCRERGGGRAASCTSGIATLSAARTPRLACRRGLAADDVASAPQTALTLHPQPPLTLLLPPVWDTFVCPIYFWATSQSERRHVSLSDLDRRITVLLFTFVSWLPCCPPELRSCVSQRGQRRAELAAARQRGSSCVSAGAKESGSHSQPRPPSWTPAGRVQHLSRVGAGRSHLPAAWHLHVQTRWVGGSNAAVPGSAGLACAPGAPRAQRALPTLPRRLCRVLASSAGRRAARLLHFFHQLHHPLGPGLQPVAIPVAPHGCARRRGPAGKRAGRRTGGRAGTCRAPLALLILPAPGHARPLCAVCNPALAPALLRPLLLAGVGLSMTFHTLHLMRPTCERDAAMTRYPPSFRPPRQFGKFMLITVSAEGARVESWLPVPPGHAVAPQHPPASRRSASPSAAPASTHPTLHCPPADHGPFLCGGGAPGAADSRLLLLRSMDRVAVPRCAPSLRGRDEQPLSARCSAATATHACACGLTCSSSPPRRLQPCMSTTAATRQEVGRGCGCGGPGPSELQAELAGCSL